MPSVASLHLFIIIAASAAVVVVVVQINAPLCRHLYWSGHQTSPTVVSLTHSHTITPFGAPGKQAF